MKGTAALVTLIAMSTIACDGSTLDAGGNKKDRDDGVDGGVHAYHWLGAVSNSTGVGCPYDAPAAYAGTWEGAFDSPSPLPDGATSMRVEVQGRSAEGLCGTMTFGYESAPPALPVDATSPYAPGLPGDPAYYERSIVDRFRPMLGFRYEFGRASADAGAAFWVPEVPAPSTDVLLVDIAQHQPYKAWCNLQTSYQYVDPDFGIVTYWCLPPGPDYIASPRGCSNGEMPVSCTQMTICLQPYAICSCSRAGCTAGDVTSFTEPVVHIDGDTMTGTIDLDGVPAVGTPSSFRLTRVHP